MVLIDKNLKCKSKVIPQHAIKLHVGVIQGGTQGGLPVYSRKPPTPSKIKKRKFCRHGYIKVLRNLPFSWNQPLKSAHD